ncbi:MAG: hypothetical protein FD165_2449 [Gammaproteobacteria bacterium]|nr:MAG: hypothetical protein FD165_2449 [Gammaproteobacteria bacterium]TND03637.1 MAG: hypothetical protein FD120_1793 [Gammaproteobacteria bacterium]
MNRLAKHTQGFSMVEVLVSLTILGFGLLALAKLQATTLFGADRAKQITEAINAGQAAMENLRNFATIGDYVGIVNESYDTTATASSWDNTIYSLDSTVDDTDKNYKKIRMDVSWTDQRNEPQTVTLSSTISRSDPVVGGRFMLADNIAPITPP